MGYLADGRLGPMDRSGVLWHGMVNMASQRLQRRIIKQRWLGDMGILWGHACVGTKRRWEESKAFSGAKGGFDDT